MALRPASATPRKLVSPRNAYTLEGWFKTNSTTGGKLFGFGNKTTTNSSKYDRHVYMDNSGQIVFGVAGLGVQTVISKSAYRNNAWHHVVATQGPSGMKLYVDGALVGQNTNGKYGAGGYWGYWRIGGDNLTSWPSKPTSNFFKGSLDEVALYHRELTAAEVTAHRTAGTGGNVLPTASFTETVTDLKVDRADGSASVDPDGKIASYAWTFGDGSTATGVTAEPHLRGGRDLPGQADRDRQRGRQPQRRPSRSTVTRAERAPPAAAFTTSAEDLAAGRSTASDRPTPTARSARTPGTFGDGVTGTGATASHTYAAGGTYDVKLTVTDDDGATTNLTKQVTVSPPNVGPSAAFTSAGTELEMSFDGSGSTDSDGTVASYAWDFGDGETGTGARSTHTYATAGHLRREADRHRQRRRDRHRDQAGRRLDRPTTSRRRTSPSRRTSSSSASTPRTPPTPTAPIDSYAWDFGDGRRAPARRPSTPTSAAGTYEVELTVTDDDGATDTHT